MNNRSAGSPLQILLVEDHRELAENIFEFFEGQYQLDYAADGLTALHLLATQRYDLVILDIMLPGVNGLTLCQRIRQDMQSSVPIIMLTAKDSIDDKSAGFDAGADDYLVKPFHLRELAMRIQALFRRGQQGASNNTVIRVGSLHYNPSTLTFSTAHTQLVLSGYSATILELLMRNAPAYVNHQAISNALWGYEDGSVQSIRTHLYSLRKQLKDATGTDFINTLHGRGYQFNDLPNSTAGSHT